jgi:hypothetical protein
LPEEVNLEQIQLALAQQALFELGILLVIVIGFFWAMYAITKAAIRDGIKEGLREAGLIKALARSSAPTIPAGLPDIRAER